MPGRIVVAGASGLIGRALVESLRADGIEVRTLVRRAPAAPYEIEWLQDTSPLDPELLEGAEAVVNLNGASIGHIPWTRSYKRSLLWSRLTPTRTLATAIRALGASAPAFVSASAVGFYGSAPGRALTESSPPGGEFLSGICVEWENAALAAGDQARVALLRTAPVVHPEGVLKPLMLLTKAGLSGPLGGGRQVWPWISLTDEVRAIRAVIERDIAGPVNLAGPTRATANDLGFALARRMNRPFAIPAPAWAIRLGLGRDMADSVLLGEAHVLPEVLRDASFTFTHPTVEDAVAAAVPAR